MRILFFLSGLIMTFHAALAGNIECPNTIRTNQSLQKKVNGWGVFLDDWNLSHRFNQATFYANHPKEHASLAPKNEKAKNIKQTWTFDKNKIWLACGYSNTNIQLIQKLPDGIKKCTVTYDKNFSKITAINCI